MWSHMKEREKSKWRIGVPGGTHRTHSAEKIQHSKGSNTLLSQNNQTKISIICEPKQYQSITNNKTREIREICHKIHQYFFSFRSAWCLLFQIIIDNLCATNADSNPKSTTTCIMVSLSVEGTLNNDNPYYFLSCRELSLQTIAILSFCLMPSRLRC